MSNRTKEALIAQYDIKKRKGLKRFSLASSTESSTAFLLIGIAIVLLVVPFILPDLTKGFWQSRITGAVLKQELSNDVYSGQFKLSPFSGDTKPNSDATFWGVYITKNAGLKLQNEASAQTYIQQKHEGLFNNNTKEIYQGIVTLKSLGLLTLDEQSPISKQIVDKYYATLLALNEKYSGFLPAADFSSTVEATYYAFEAIQELGRFEDFRARAEFDSAIGFVVSMKDAETKGFRNTASNNATIATTYQAVQVLKHKESELVSGALAGVEKFVQSTQVKDGGFLDVPVESVEELYTSVSTSATTSQALYILHTLKKLGLITLGLTDVNGVMYFDGVSYLKSTLNYKYGIVRSFPGQGTDLEGAYHFQRLVKDFPVSYGTPRIVEFSFVGLALYLIVYAIFVYARSQLRRQTLKEVGSVIRTVTFFVVLGAIALVVYPAAAIVVYLAFVAYVAVKYYEISLTDNTDGMMIVTAVCHTATFLAAYAVFVVLSPVSFANVRVFYIVTGVEIVAFFGVTLVAVYTAEVNRISFYVSAGFLGWVANVVLFYSFLYGRGDFDIAFRLLFIHGHFPIVFVVLPIITLFAAYGMSAYAAYLFFERKDSEDRAADKKKAKSEQKKSEKPTSETKED
eukprot:TRINITY_DN1653_c0_g5_i1.p1 TRINITY_DN1653_c0_g5~~TRINITY_DN1653_c0_g5_i1.p1  ORF type:complete len:627 (+),score=156.48 TRINITY_DN1653_c0_g5_i1:147-2027(+)